MIFTDNDFKSYDQLKHELGDKYDKTMYDMNKELLIELEKYKSAFEELKEYITKESITIQGVEVLEQEDLIDKMEELEQKYNLNDK